MLEIKNLRKKYRDKEVLRDVSLTVEAGQVVSLIGPSGAGKTSLIRCINNLESMDGGLVKINGRELRPGDRTRARDIGLVFQNYNLFPHMNVMENIVEAPIRVFSEPRIEVEARARELLINMSMEDKALSYPYELSGGEKQRVAMARAMILNPKILCLDEPTSALDPASKKEVVTIIEGLVAQGVGFLIISHDMDFVETISHRVVFLDRGRVINKDLKGNLFS